MVAFLTDDELEQIPSRYRVLVKVLLKLPNPSLPFSVQKHLPAFEGIFWAIIIPILLIAYFSFSVWSFPSLTALVGFPLNVILGFITPTVIFLFFLRIQLEREILWWRNIRKPVRKWETSKRAEELAQLLEKQQKRNREAV